MLEPWVACEVFCGGFPGLRGMCTYYTPPQKAGGVLCATLGLYRGCLPAAITHPPPGNAKSYLVDKKETYGRSSKSRVPSGQAENHG
jgi:hypothetical protein